MRKVFLTFLGIILGFQLSASRIEGTITDGETSELLVGVSVFLKDNIKYSTSSGLDGTYNLRNLPAGSHTIVYRLISYETIEQKIQISDNANQKISVALTPQGLELTSVVVTASSNSTDYGARKLEKLSPNILNSSFPLLLKLSGWGCMFIKRLADNTLSGCLNIC